MGNVRSIPLTISAGVKFDKKALEKSFGKNINEVIKDVSEGKGKFKIDLTGFVDDNGNPIDPAVLEKFEKDASKQLNTVIKSLADNFSEQAKTELADSLTDSLTETFNELFANMSKDILDGISSIQEQINASLGNISVNPRQQTAVDLGDNIEVRTDKAEDKIQKSARQLTKELTKARADIAKAQNRINALQSQMKTPKKIQDTEDFIGFFDDDKVIQDKLSTPRKLSNYITKLISEREKAFNRLQDAGEDDYSDKVNEDNELITKIDHTLFGALQLDQSRIKQYIEKSKDEFKESLEDAYADYVDVIKEANSGLNDKIEREIKIQNDIIQQSKNKIKEISEDKIGKLLVDSKTPEKVISETDGKGKKNTAYLHIEPTLNTSHVLKVILNTIDSVQQGLDEYPLHANIAPPTDANMSEYIASIYSAIETYFADPANQLDVNINTTKIIEDIQKALQAANINIGSANIGSVSTVGVTSTDNSNNNGSTGNKKNVLDLMSYDLTVDHTEADEEMAAFYSQMQADFDNNPVEINVNTSEAERQVNDFAESTTRNVLDAMSFNADDDERQAYYEQMAERAANASAQVVNEQEQTIEDTVTKLVGAIETVPHPELQSAYDLLKIYEQVNQLKNKKVSEDPILKYLNKLKSLPNADKINQLFSEDENFKKEYQLRKSTINEYIDTQRKLATYQSVKARKEKKQDVGFFDNVSYEATQKKLDAEQSTLEKIIQSSKNRKDELNKIEQITKVDSQIKKVEDRLAELNKSEIKKGSPEAAEKKQLQDRLSALKTEKTNIVNSISDNDKQEIANLDIKIDKYEKMLALLKQNPEKYYENNSGLEEFANKYGLSLDDIKAKEKETLQETHNFAVQLKKEYDSIDEHLSAANMFTEKGVSERIESEQTRLAQLKPEEIQKVYSDIAETQTRLNELSVSNYKEGSQEAKEKARLEKTLLSLQEERDQYEKSLSDDNKREISNLEVQIQKHKELLTLIQQNPDKYREMYDAEMKAAEAAKNATQYFKDYTLENVITIFQQIQSKTQRALVAAQKSLISANYNRSYLSDEYNDRYEKGLERSRGIIRLSGGARTRNGWKKTNDTVQYTSKNAYLKDLEDSKKDLDYLKEVYSYYNDAGVKELEEAITELKQDIIENEKTYSEKDSWEKTTATARIFVRDKNGKWKRNKSEQKKDRFKETIDHQKTLLSDMENELAEKNAKLDRSAQVTKLTAERDQLTKEISDLQTELIKAQKNQEKAREKEIKKEISQKRNQKGNLTKLINTLKDPYTNQQSVKDRLDKAQEVYDNIYAAIDEYQKTTKSYDRERHGKIYNYKTYEESKYQLAVNSRKKKALQEENAKLDPDKDANKIIKNQNKISDLDRSIAALNSDINNTEDDLKEILSLIEQITELRNELSKGDLSETQKAEINIKLSDLNLNLNDVVGRLGWKSWGIQKFAKDYNRENNYKARRNTAAPKNISDELYADSKDRHELISKIDEELAQLDQEDKKLELMGKAVEARIAGIKTNFRDKLMEKYNAGDYNKIIARDQNSLNKASSQYQNTEKELNDLLSMAAEDQIKYITDYLNQRISKIDSKINSSTDQAEINRLSREKEGFVKRLNSSNLVEDEIKIRQDELNTLRINIKRYKNSIENFTNQLQDIDSYIAARVEKEFLNYEYRGKLESQQSSIATQKVYNDDYRKDLLKEKLGTALEGYINIPSDQLATEEAKQIGLTLYQTAKELFDQFEITIQDVWAEKEAALLKEAHQYSMELGKIDPENLDEVNSVKNKIEKINSYITETSSTIQSLMTQPSKNTASLSENLEQRDIWNQEKIKLLNDIHQYNIDLEDAKTEEEVNAIQNKIREINDYIQSVEAKLSTGDNKNYTDYLTEQIDKLSLPLEEYITSISSEVDNRFSNQITTKENQIERIDNQIRQIDENIVETKKLIESIQGEKYKTRKRKRKDETQSEYEENQKRAKKNIKAGYSTRNQKIKSIEKEIAEIKGEIATLVDSGASNIDLNILKGSSKSYGVNIEERYKYDLLKNQMPVQREAIKQQFIQNYRADIQRLKGLIAQSTDENLTQAYQAQLQTIENKLNNIDNDDVFYSEINLLKEAQEFNSHKKEIEELMKKKVDNVISVEENKRLEEFLETMEKLNQAGVNVGEINKIKDANQTSGYRIYSTKPISIYDNKYISNILKDYENYDVNRQKIGDFSKDLSEIVNEYIDSLLKEFTEEFNKYQNSTSTKDKQLALVNMKKIINDYEHISKKDKLKDENGNIIPTDVLFGTIDQSLLNKNWQRIEEQVKTSGQSETQKAQNLKNLEQRLSHLESELSFEQKRIADQQESIAKLEAQKNALENQKVQLQEEINTLKTEVTNEKAALSGQQYSADQSISYTQRGAVAKKKEPVEEQKEGQTSEETADRVEGAEERKQVAKQDTQKASQRTQTEEAKEGDVAEETANRVVAAEEKKQVAKQELNDIEDSGYGTADDAYVLAFNQVREIAEETNDALREQSGIIQEQTSTSSPVAKQQEEAKVATDNENNALREQETIVQEQAENPPVITPEVQPTNTRAELGAELSKEKVPVNIEPHIANPTETAATMSQEMAGHPVEVDIVPSQQSQEQLANTFVNIAQGANVNISGDVHIDDDQWGQLSDYTSKLSDSILELKDSLNKTTPAINAIATTAAQATGNIIGDIDSISNNLNTTLDSSEIKIKNFGKSIKANVLGTDITDNREINNALEEFRTALDSDERLKKLSESSDVTAKYVTKKVGTDAKGKAIYNKFVELSALFKDTNNELVRVIYNYDAANEKMTDMSVVSATLSNAFTEQQNSIKLAQQQLNYFSTQLDKANSKFNEYGLNDFGIDQNGELVGKTEKAENYLSVITDRVKNIIIEAIKAKENVNGLFVDLKRASEDGLSSEDFKERSDEFALATDEYRAVMNQVNRNFTVGIEHDTRKTIEQFRKQLVREESSLFDRTTGSLIGFDTESLTQEGQEYINVLRDLLEQLEELYNQFKTQDIFTDNDRISWDSIIYQISDVKKKLRSQSAQKFVNGKGTLIEGMSIDSDVFEEIQKDATLARRTLGELAQSINENEIELGELSNQNKTLSYSYKDANGNIQQCAISVDNLGSSIRNLIKKSSPKVSLLSSLFNGLKDKMFELGKYFSAYQIFYKVLNSFRDGIRIVKELDTAMTEMRKVSSDTEAELQSFAKSSHQIAQEIGSTAAIIQNSAADWMRLGYSVKDAAELAKNTSILMNVSEFESIESATESMVAIVQAFKDANKDVGDLSLDIIDKLNNIGNNFSISTSEIAQSLQRSSGALIAAGNDLDEAIALTTAANAIIQDPESTGSALKVISMRLRGTSVKELEDAGEDTEGVIETVSKLEKKIKQLTSINGKLGVSILDANGNYRDTYEILQDIADIWEEIGEADKKDGQNRQAALLEAMAGKTRSQSLASLLQNPDMLREVYEASKVSEGSAQRENEEYLASIEAHIQILTAKWQEFWNSAINRDQINWVIDRASDLLDIAKEIGTIPSLAIIFGGVAGVKGLANKNSGRNKKPFLIIAGCYSSLSWDTSLNIA